MQRARALGGLARSWLYRRRSRPSEARHVFVLGAPRSGTTLLQTVLASHPELWSIAGETGMFTRQNLFDPSRCHLELAPNEIQQLLKSSRGAVEFFDHAVAKRRQSKGKRGRFVEKTPQHVLQLAWILRMFPASKVLHVVRDGRDALVSSRSNPRVVQGADTSRFARYWSRCLDARERSARDPRVFDVRYEDFAADPEVVLASLMSHLELDVHPEQLSASARRADPRSQEGAFRRLGQPIGTSSVGKWRTELAPREAELFDTIAGEHLIRWGYELLTRVKPAGEER